MRTVTFPKSQRPRRITKKKVQNKDAWELTLSTFIFPGLAVIGIAAGEDPASDLLDMVVFATLQHRVLADGWAEEVLGKQAGPLLETQKALDEQAWHIARDVLSDQQQKDLRAMIEHWLRQNPHQRYVSNVHFDDISLLRGRNVVNKSSVTGDGLLAPIDEAVRKAEDLRLLAERGIYLMQRMPPLLLAQTRYVIHESVKPEQIETLTQDFSSISKSLSDAQKTIATVPHLVSSERAALFTEWDKRQTSFAKLLADTTPAFEAGRGMVEEMGKTVTAVDKLAVTYQQAGGAINETLIRYNDLLRSMDSEPPSDPELLIRKLDALIRLGQELNHLAGQADKLPVPLLRETLVGAAEELLDALLWRVLALTASILFMLFLYRYLARRYLLPFHSNIR